MSAREILQQIRQLPENERRELAEQVLTEFGYPDEELSPEQIAELDRRAEEALKFPGRGKAAEQVFAEIEERFRRGK